jgi:hypothetical protein
MSAEEFFHYLEAHWAHAEQHGSRPAPGVLQMLRAIRDSDLGVGKRPGDISARTHRAYRSGYLSEQRLLWIRRSELTWLAKAIGKSEYARDFVDKKGAFIDRTTKCAISHDVDSPGRGVVLVGRSEARTRNDILWIGITTDRALASLDLAERAARLAMPIARYPARARLPWANHADLVRSIAVAHAADVRQTTRELFATDLTTVNEHIDLLHAGDPEAQLLWHAPDGISDLKQAFEEHGELPVVVAGRDTFDELRTIAVTLIGTDNTLSGVPIVILDRERLADELSHYPWLWSERFGKELGFHIIHGDDDDRLRDLLIGRSRVPELVADDLQHPAVQLRSLRGARLVGRDGSGRTTALYFIARGYKTGLTVVVLNPLSEQERRLVRDMVRDCAEEVEGERSTKVILDDVLAQEFSVAPYQTTLARLMSLRDVADVTLLVSYRRRDRSRVLETYAAMFSDLGLSHEVDLDEPPVPFVRELVRRAMTKFDAYVPESDGTPESMREHLVLESDRFTIGELAEQIRDSAGWLTKGTVTPPVDIAHHQTKLDEIVRERRWEELTILRLLVMIHRCPEVVLRWYLREQFNIPSVAINAAINALRGNRWIVSYDGAVWLNDWSLRGLLTGTEQDAFAKELAEWTAARMTDIPARRTNILASVLTYLDSPKHVGALRAAILSEDELQQERDRGLWKAMWYTARELDNPQLFRDVMRELLVRYQTDIEAADHILNDLWVLGYRGAAHDLLQWFAGTANEVGTHLREKLTCRWGTDRVSETELLTLAQDQPAPG